MTIRFDAHELDPPLNLDNLALRQLPMQWPVERDRFTQVTGHVPIMIRLHTGSGLTACTAMTYYIDARSSFLSEGRILLLASSRGGLLTLMARQGMEATGLQPADVAVAGAGQYDFPDTLAALEDGLDEGSFRRLLKVFDLSYRLSLWLGLDELASLVLAPSSELGRFYRLAIWVNSGELSHEEAWHRLQTHKHYALADVATYLHDVAARLALHVAYYHQDLVSPGADDMAAMAFWNPGVPKIRLEDVTATNAEPAPPHTVPNKTNHANPPRKPAREEPAATTSPHVRFFRGEARVRHRPLPPDPQRALRAKELSDKGISLLASFETAGIDADLERAIARLREALAVAAPNDPHRPTYWLNLAKGLQASYERDTNHDHLDEAIALMRKAMGVVGNDYQELPEMQRTMGMLLALRFARDTSPWDMDEAMALTAVAMRRHPNHLLAMHARAHALRHRWETQQHRQDLDAIIELGKAMLANQQPGLQRAETLWILSRDRCHRYDLAGLPEDIDAAVDASRTALKECPADHPRRPRYVYGLAYAKHRRLADAPAGNNSHDSFQ
ncbi:hypothetical protein Rhe02_78540 [Rhizocola hellebori]|uniref:Tetratricopeptide repeat protein n=1 Tax=Rhizocola hellebori TaxID=1392758 RepID=A0A8J3QHM9_9ACTN|nr:hypothetical protein [Rhizocola hellebori]GIH09787.1 hypothetical protein Rhe02_78540 [Rhizocola hellebori]